MTEVLTVRNNLLSQMFNLDNNHVVCTVLQHCQPYDKKTNFSVLQLLDYRLNTTESHHINIKMSTMSASCDLHSSMSPSADSQL